MELIELIYFNLPSSNWEPPKWIHAKIIDVYTKIHRLVNIRENTRGTRTQITELTGFLKHMDLFVGEDEG